MPIETFRPHETVPIKGTLVYESSTLRPFSPVDPFISSGVSSDPEGHPYVQVSPNHGRTLIDQRPESVVIWTDEYNNIYGSTNFKGTILPGKTSDRAFLAYPNGRGRSAQGPPEPKGLVKNLNVHRLVDASTILRQHDILTEHITRIWRIDAIFTDSLNIGPPGAEHDTLLPRSIICAPRLDQSDPRGNSTPMADVINELDNGDSSYATDEYFIIERDTQVAERIRDIPLLNQQDWDSKFKWLKIAISLKPKSFYKPEMLEDILSSNNDDRIKRYILEWLPGQIGWNLGNFHRLGVYLNGAHSQNWSIFGTFCDLDSLKGKPLGDEQKPSTRDYVADLGWTWRDFLRSVEGKIDEKQEDHYAHWDDEGATKIIINLNTTYLLSRFRDRLRDQLSPEQTRILKEEMRDSFSYLNIPIPGLDKHWQMQEESERVTREWFEKVIRVPTLDQII